MYYVYILKDIVTGKYYTGQTNNIDRRIYEHKTGQSKYTSQRGPFKLIYSEQHYSRSEAVKRERYFKTGKGREYLKKILDP